MTAQLSDLLLVPAERCDRCPAMPGLLAATVAGRLCADCWKELPEDLKWQPAPTTVQDIHEAELATRKRMQARGGADRYRVTAGKT